MKDKCTKCNGTGEIELEEPDIIDKEKWRMNEIIDAINYLIVKDNHKEV